MEKLIIFIALAAVMLFCCASCGGKAAVSLESDETKADDTQTADDTGKVYTIADYYDANGGFSALGLALDEENGEKALIVHAGDVLVVGARKYHLSVASHTIPFYTQPSFDDVIVWWMEYCEGLRNNGEMFVVSD